MGSSRASERNWGSFIYCLQRALGFKKNLCGFWFIKNQPLFFLKDFYFEFCFDHFFESFSTSPDSWKTQTIQWNFWISYFGIFTEHQFISFGSQDRWDIWHTSSSDFKIYTNCYLKLISRNLRTNFKCVLMLIGTVFFMELSKCIPVVKDPFFLFLFRLFFLIDLSGILFQHFREGKWV